MSPEAQRDAIAALCGWEYCEDTQQMVFVKDGDIIGLDWPSLDAMHEAEAHLYGTPDICNYEMYLLRAATTHSPFCATAAQRAEAFLKTIGQWNP